MFFFLLLWALLGVQGTPRQNKPANPSNPSDANGNPAPEVKPATVRGKVVAADSGAPIKRAQVVLRLNSVGNTTFLATTDASGVYEIKNIDPGTYSASASKSGFVLTQLTRGGSNNFAPLILAENQEVKD